MKFIELSHENAKNSKSRIKQVEQKSTSNEISSTNSRSLIIKDCDSKKPQESPKHRNLNRTTETKSMVINYVNVLNDAHHERGTLSMKQSKVRERELVVC